MLRKLSNAKFWLDLWAYAAWGLFCYRLGKGSGSWLWYTSAAWAPALLLGLTYLIAWTYNRWYRHRHLRNL